ncbi:MAG TPA: hypothetical protein VGK67_00890 [Myxococcales bacterium]|jgi:hypothetical protein
MLSNFDDYPIHQTSEPVAHPAPTDRNFYDRYWFNGIAEDGLYLGATMGLYPNRQVMDAGFSVLVGKQQHCLHVSRRAPGERSDLRVGPVSLEVVKPMREIRLRVAGNETGVECDLVFRARTAPHEEPRSRFHQDNRLIMDTSRFAQYGRWEGWVKAAGERIEVKPEKVLGARDRSWGVRPVGEPERGATPQGEPGIYWIWGALHFDDSCIHYETLEDHDGRAGMLHAAILPAYPTPEVIPAVESGAQPCRASHMIAWKSGTRWPASAQLKLAMPDGKEQTLILEPISRFHLKGIGYQHPQWGLGMWKGEEAIAGEVFDVDGLSPQGYENNHAHTVCRLRLGDRVGLGTLETVVLGSHKPSGFKGMLDGAA